MPTPIDGVFLGATALMSIDGTDDEAVTKLDLRIENVYKEIGPIGKALPYQKWVGRRINITAEREMIDDTFFTRALTGTPTTGSANTLASGKTVTAGTAIPMSTSTDAKNGRVEATLAASPITTGGKLWFFGTDANDDPLVDVVVVTAADAAGTKYTTRRVFKTCTSALPDDIVTAGTLDFASLSGDTTVNGLDEPAFMTIIAKLGPKSGSTKKVWVQMNNCQFKTTGFSASSMDTVKNTVEIVMVNPNDDFLETVSS